MTFSTTFTPGMRGSDSLAQHPDASNKPERRGLFGRKMREQGTAQATQSAPKTAMPSTGGVFAEAGRPQGARRGFFSTAVSFFTASHPDTIRRRAEGVGDDFAKRVNNFEQGKFNRLAGPFFGMPFKNYDRDPSTQSAQPFTAPSGAGNGSTAGSAPFAAGGHNPTNGAGSSPFAQPHQPSSGGYAPPPIHDPAAFQRYASNVGDQFAQRMNTFAQNPTPGGSPFAGMGRANYDQPRTATPERPAPRAAFSGSANASPNAASAYDAAFRRHVEDVGRDFAQRVNGHSWAAGSNPLEGINTRNPTPVFGSAPTDPSRQAPSVRVDQAKTEYRNALEKLKTGLESKKEAAHVMVAEEISLHTARIDQIGRELNESLQRLEAETASKKQKMTEELASMDRMVKDLANQMRPLQRAAFAAGTNSRGTVGMDAETAARRARNAEISQLRNDIKEQREKTEAELNSLPERMDGLRTSIMNIAEMNISDLNIKIDGAKAALSRTLNAMDNDFAEAKATETQRIAAKYDVRFA